MYQMSSILDKAVKSGARPGPRRERGLAPGKLNGAGVVGYFVYGPMENREVPGFAPAGLIKILEGGLPVRELAELQSGLDVPAERLAPMLGISKATFHRRKGAGSKLKLAVSDRVVRFARILGKAAKIFGGLENARLWLNSPQFGLGGAAPLDWAKTETGAREVENLLGRIEYGVYS